MRELYGGMDLHSRNTYIGIMDTGSEKKVFRNPKFSKYNGNLPTATRSPKQLSLRLRFGGRPGH
jgi:hypothetical protein